MTSAEEWRNQIIDIIPYNVAEAYVYDNDPWEVEHYVKYFNLIVNLMEALELSRLQLKQFFENKLEELDYDDKKLNEYIEDGIFGGIFYENFKIDDDDIWFELEEALEEPFFDEMYEYYNVRVKNNLEKNPASWYEILRDSIGVKYALEYMSGEIDSYEETEIENREQSYDIRAGYEAYYRGLVWQDGSVLEIGGGTDHRIVDINSWSIENIATYHYSDTRYGKDVSIRIHGRMSNSQRRVLHKFIKDVDPSVVYLEIYNKNDKMVYNGEAELWNWSDVVYEYVGN